MNTFFNVNNKYPAGSGILGGFNQTNPIPNDAFQTPVASDTVGLSKSQIGAGIGGALSAVSGIMDIFAQGDNQRAIGEQLDLSNAQYDLQISQINSNQNIADLASIQQANKQYSTQLAQAGATGASLQSSAIGGVLDETVRNDKIRNFGNEMTATTQKLNTFMAKVQTDKQAQQKLQASQNQVAGSLISAGASIAMAVAIML
jgi:hypothetical protein